MRNSQDLSPHSTTVESLSQAVFTVNRHAKTAINPKYLYSLKKQALQKMINEGKATKVGLHFSNNPRFSQQQSDVLVDCGMYTFHIPPAKSDFENLPHLGTLDKTTRNPKCRMSLGEAKVILEKYTGMKEKKETSQGAYGRTYQKPVFKKLGDSY